MGDITNGPKFKNSQTSDLKITLIPEAPPPPSGVSGWLGLTRVDLHVAQQVAFLTETSAAGFVVQRLTQQYQLHLPTSFHEHTESFNDPQM